MDYINEIKAFYDWAEEHQLSASHISVWHGLMYLANKWGWPDDLTVSMQSLESRTGLKRGTIYKARNKLKQLGAIDFKERSGNQCAVYTLCSRLRSYNEHKSIHKGDTNVNTKVTQTSNINNTIQDNTINNINNTCANEKKSPQWLGALEKCALNPRDEVLKKITAFGFCDDVVCFAISLTERISGNLSYLLKVLSVWEGAGVVTLLDARREYERHLVASRKGSKKAVCDVGYDYDLLEKLSNSSQISID